MTVLVGLECPTGAWVSTDSFFGNDTWRDVMAAPKHVMRGGLLIASAGAMRPGQIAELAPIIRKQRRSENDTDYLAEAFAEPLRKLHKAADVDNASATYLLAYRGRVYTMLSDYGVYRSALGYAAVGAGDRYALGSLASTEGKPPRERVEKAMHAAALLCSCVAAPFHTTFVPTRPVPTPKVAGGAKR